jgi:hypothetical protein
MARDKVTDWEEVVDRSPATDDWEEVTDWVEEKDPITYSPAHSFARSVGSGLTFDFRDEIAGALESPMGAIKKAAGFLGYNTKGDSDVEKYLAERNASRALDVEHARQNPKASLAGELTGAVTTSFVPGLGVAKGAKTLDSLKKAAKLGAVYGTGSSNAENLGGLVTDATLSAAGGAAGQGLGIAVDKAVPALLGRLPRRNPFASKAGGLANKLDDFAERRAVKQAGAMLGDERSLKYQNRLNDTGKILLDEQIVTPLSGIQKVVDRTKTVLEESGRKLGQTEKLMDKYFHLIQKNNLPTVFFNPSMVAARIDAEIVDQVAKSPALGNYAGSLRGISERLRQMGDRPIPFSKAGEIKREFDELVKYDRGQTAPKELIKQIRGIVNDEMEWSVMEASKAIDKPLFQKWSAEKKKYGLLSKVAEMAEDKISRNDANRWLSPSDYAVGLTGVIAGSDDAPGGSLTNALMGVAANRVARGYGNALMSTSARGLAKGIRKAPEIAAVGSNAINASLRTALSDSPALPIDQDPGERVRQYLLQKVGERAPQSLNREPAMGVQRDAFMGSGLANNISNANRIAKERLSPKPKLVYEEDSQVAPGHAEEDYRQTIGPTNAPDIDAMINMGDHPDNQKQNIMDLLSTDDFIDEDPEVDTMIRNSLRQRLEELTDAENGEGPLDAPNPYGDDLDASELEERYPQSVEPAVPQLERNQLIEEVIKRKLRQDPVFNRQDDLMLKQYQDRNYQNKQNETETSTTSPKDVLGRLARNPNSAKFVPHIQKPWSAETKRLAQPISY